MADAVVVRIFSVDIAGRVVRNGSACWTFWMNTVAFCSGRARQGCIRPGEKKKSDKNIISVLENEE